MQKIKKIQGDKAEVVTENQFLGSTQEQARKLINGLDHRNGRSIEENELIRLTSLVNVNEKKNILEVIHSGGRKNYRGARSPAKGREVF